MAARISDDAPSCDHFSCWVRRPYLRRNLSYVVEEKKRSSSPNEHAGLLDVAVCPPSFPLSTVVRLILCVDCSPGDSSAPLALGLRTIHVRQHCRKTKYRVAFNLSPLKSIDRPGPLLLFIEVFCVRPPSSYVGAKPILRGSVKLRSGVGEGSAWKCGHKRLALSPPKPGKGPMCAVRAERISGARQALARCNLTQETDSSDDDSSPLAPRVTRGAAERASHQRRKRKASRDLRSLSVDLAELNPDERNLHINVWSRVVPPELDVTEKRTPGTNSVPRHVFVGLFEQFPMKRFARADNVCPLCLANLYRSISLSAHICMDHEEFQLICAHVMVGVEDASEANGSRSAFVDSPGDTPRAVSVYQRTDSITPVQGILLELVRRHGRDYSQTLEYAGEQSFGSFARFSGYSPILRSSWTSSVRCARDALPSCDAPPNCSCVSCQWPRSVTKVAPKKPSPMRVQRGTELDRTDLEVDFSGMRLSDLPKPKKKPLSVAPMVVPKPAGVRDSIHLQALRKALRKESLFHIVTLADFGENHIPTNVSETEDDVDDSWQQRLAEDSLNEFRDVTPKQKVLWNLWNRFKCDGYAGGAFGYQYTRYSLELFATREGAAVRDLGLRIEFVAFLKALHVYGQIDGPATLSILACLDGLKSVDDCARSSQPLPSTFDGLPDPANAPAAQAKKPSRAKRSRHRSKRRDGSRSTAR